MAYDVSYDFTYQTITVTSNRFAVGDCYEKLKVGFYQKFCHLWIQIG